MPERRIYPRPPITEALIEFRLANSCKGDLLYQTLKAQLGAEYTGEPLQKDLIEALVQVQGDKTAMSSSRAPHMTFLRSVDGLRLIGCGDSVVSVHVLAPYPGWENFIDHARKAVVAAPEDIKNQGFTAISVRYIDRIEFPMHEPLDLSDYFVHFPQQPPSLAGGIMGFHFVTQTIDSESNIMTTLRLAGSFNQDGRFEVIYDNHLVRMHMADTMISPNMWEDVVEDLHTRQRDIFEESITDKMRELFV